MRRITAGVFTMVLIALVFTTPILGQRRGQGRIYDPKTEATITGTVAEMTTVPSRGGGRGLGGAHVMLNTGTETLDVHLGPAAFLEEQQFPIAKGDTLQVVGSRVTVDGAPAFIAREVRRDGVTLTLRDADGRPKWAGGPRR